MYVPSEQGTVKIDIADLIYIESAKHYLYLHTSKETFRLRSTMGDFIAQLPTGRFSCCSKSFCVNLEWISRYQGNSVFVNGKELSISRSYKKTFIDQMTMYINRGGN
ncbi:MAG: LytR/AlgR family response regulator transcription factor [Ruminococcus sp.]